MTETEIGVMRSAAKECWEPPRAGRSKDSQKPLERTRPANTLMLAPENSFLTSGLQDCKRIHCYCFTPLKIHGNLL